MNSFYGFSCENNLFSVKNYNDNENMWEYLIQIGISKGRVNQESNINVRKYIKRKQELMNSISIENNNERYEDLEEDSDTSDNNHI